MADVNEIETGSNAVSRQHYTFEDILYHFICSTRYPENMKDKGEKANFTRAAKGFAVNDGKLKFVKTSKDGSQRENDFI